MKVLQNKVLLHFSFWIISGIILLNHFRASSTFAPTDYIFTAIFLSFIVGAVYCNLWQLSRFVNTKYGLLKSGVLAVVIITLFSFLLIYGFDPVVELFFSDYYLISYFDFTSTALFFLIFIGLSSLLHFSQSWFQLKESEAQVARLEKEKLNSELSALRSQVNPHFLFNSLNSIYALVMNNSVDASEAILKLSDALRYVIYEADTARVPIKKEIAFITDYVGLQKLRCRKNDDVKLTIKVADGETEVAPLLLIVLVENCFKHGLRQKKGKSFIHIDIVCREGTLLVKTENNINEGVLSTADSKGTGLNNLKRRLAAEYLHHHHLTLDSNNDIFTAELSIEL